MAHPRHLSLLGQRVGKASYCPNLIMQCRDESTKYMLGDHAVGFCQKDERPLRSSETSSQGHLFAFARVLFEHRYTLRIRPCVLLCHLDSPVASSDAQHNFNVDRVNRKQRIEAA